MVCVHEFNYRKTDANGKEHEGSFLLNTPFLPPMELTSGFFLTVVFVSPSLWISSFLEASVLQ